MWSYAPSSRPPQPSFRRKPESRAYSHMHRHPGPPQPSFRRKPESRAYSHMHRHSGPPNRHSGASRNLGRVVICTVIPAPPSVIPAGAGIYGVRSHTPSFRLPHPSFRRKPESMACGHMHRHPGPPSVIPAQAGSRACGHIHRHSGSPIRHSGASRNLWRAVICTVIPAQAGIQAVWSYAPSSRLPHPSFRRKPESMLAGSITIVGDYDSGFRRKPE